MNLFECFKLLNARLIINIINGKQIKKPIPTIITLFLACFNLRNPLLLVIIIVPLLLVALLLFTLLPVVFAVPAVPAVPL